MGVKELWVHPTCSPPVQLCSTLVVASCHAPALHFKGLTWRLLKALWEDFLFPLLFLVIFFFSSYCVLLGLKVYLSRTIWKSLGNYLNSENCGPCHHMNKCLLHFYKFRGTSYFIWHRNSPKPCNNQTVRLLWSKQIYIRNTVLCSEDEKKREIWIHKKIFAEDSENLCISAQGYDLGGDCWSWGAMVRLQLDLIFKAFSNLSNSILWAVYQFLLYLL